jgi:NitT/TauT family transport system ATP-binding protein
VHDPELLLLDEPFGALDQFTREELWDIMQKLWMDRRPTVLLVTHDLRESAYLANRICVMSSRPGRILETREVGFARPRTLESSYAPAFATLVQQLRMRIADARRDGDAPPPVALASRQEEVAA